MLQTFNKYPLPSLFDMKDRDRKVHCQLQTLM